nr:cytochrome c oxidase subunit 2 [Chelopistes texanus]
MSSMSFQDSWSPGMSFILSFHDHVMVVVLFVISVVLYTMTLILMSKNNGRFITGNEALEFIWTMFPAIILACLAIPSLHTLYLADEVSNPALTIKVTGNQWFWTYQYDGFESISFNSYMVPVSDLFKGGFRLLEVDCNTIVPGGVEVRLIITSVDVIHSWTIPSLGVKVDAVPGRLNQIGLFSNRAGLMYGQCSEICGALHSFMPICVETVPLSFFKKWVSSKINN